MRLKGLLLVVLVCAISLPAHAQVALTAAQKAEASAAYESGKKKYALGKYEEAAADFEHAYQVSEQPAILYNMAQAYRLSGKFEKSLQLYRSYISLQPDSPYRDEIRRQMADLTKQLDEQKAAAARAAAEAQKKKDEADQRKEELERQKVLEGERERARREAELKAQGIVPAKEQPHFRLDYVGYGLTGVGVALLGAGAAFTGLSAVYSDDLSNAASKGQEFTHALLDKQHSGKLYNALGPALLAVGGVVAVIGVASIVVGSKWHKSDKDKGLTAVAPWLAPGAAGLAAGGRF